MINSFKDVLKGHRYFNNVIRRNPLFYKKYYNLLTSFEESSLSEVKSKSKEYLSQHLKRAEQTQYGKEYKGNSYQKWPVITKNLIRDNYNDFIKGSKVFSVTASTSGTSGTPLQLIRDFKSVVLEQASIDYIVSLKGYEFDQMKIAVLRGDNIGNSHSSTNKFWSYANKNKLIFSANHLNKNSASNYINEIKRFSPDCIYAYPTSLELLLGYLENSEIDINIPLILTSSEVVSDELREKGKNILGADFIDYYGQAERVTFAYSIDKDYYFLPYYSYVELTYVRSTDKFDVYEIIGSNFHNSKMPLVRYKTGDQIYLKKGESDIEKISLGLKPFQKIAGRESDYLVTPDGGNLMGIDHIPRDLSGVIQMQFIQHNINNVQVNVVTRRGLNKNLRKDIINKCRLKIPESIEINLCDVDSLQKTASGKTPFVIRNI